MSELSSGDASEDGFPSGCTSDYDYEWEYCGRGDREEDEELRQALFESCLEQVYQHPKRTTVPATPNDPPAPQPPPAPPEDQQPQGPPPPPPDLDALGYITYYLDPESLGALRLACSVCRQLLDIHSTLPCYRLSTAIDAELVAKWPVWRRVQVQEVDLVALSGAAVAALGRLLPLLPCLKALRIDQHAKAPVFVPAAAAAVLAAGLLGDGSGAGSGGGSAGSGRGEASGSGGSSISGCDYSYGSCESKGGDSGGSRWSDSGVASSGSGSGGGKDDAAVVPSKLQLLDIQVDVESSGCAAVLSACAQLPELRGVSMQRAIVGEVGCEALSASLAAPGGAWWHLQEAIIAGVTWDCLNLLAPACLPSLRVLRVTGSANRSAHAAFLRRKLLAAGERGSTALSCAAARAPAAGTPSAAPAAAAAAAAAALGAAAQAAEEAAAAAAAAAEAMAAPTVEVLPRLWRLELEVHSLTLELGPAFEGAPWLRQLEHLTLGWFKQLLCDDAHGASPALRRLAHAPLDALTELLLPAAGLNAAGLRLLLSGGAGTWVPRLRVLNISRNFQEKEDMMDPADESSVWRMLSGAPFQALRELNTATVRLSREGAVLLVAAPWFGGLEKVSLSGHESAEGVLLGSDVYTRLMRTGKAFFEVLKS